MVAGVELDAVDADAAQTALRIAAVQVVEQVGPVVEHQSRRCGHTIPLQMVAHGAGPSVHAHALRRILAHARETTVIITADAR